MPMSDVEWAKQFRQRVATHRVPIQGLLELTSRCNLRCEHCYLGPQEQHWARRDQEPSAEKVCSIIDEIAAAGCLYLAITGGDPMVHDDFPEIYRHARRKGMIVRVLCNGILVKDRIVELFKEYPPDGVEISLYGATSATYEAVTRVKGSYAKCLKGIQRLVDDGVHVQLKTVLLTLNSHELDDMRAIAKGFGVPFRLDSAIFPHLSDRSQAPLHLRLSPEEAVRLELSDPDEVHEWSKHLDAQAGQPPAETLYRCGAGVTGFYIDPFGQASPCLMTTKHRHSLSQRSFASLWAKELAQLRSIKPRAEYGCNSCEMQTACSGCPAFNDLETGHEDVKSDFICETTQQRFNTIQSRLGRPAAAPPRTNGRSTDGWQPIALGRRPGRGRVSEALQT